MNEHKPSLDPAIEKYYVEGEEMDRLSTHRLEKDRTLRILKKLLPPAPAVILDVGGAAGVYAFPLTEMGYEVHLIDPISLHISQANEHAKGCGCSLASISVGDARRIDREESCVDVVLFLGPLYHLPDQNDRLQALQEAYRVLKPGGILFAAGISRFASLMDAIHKGVVNSKSKVIEESLASGIHRKTIEDNTFSFLYLHYPNELKDEVQKSGFENVTIRAIEGPVWEKQVIQSLLQDKNGWEKLLVFLDQIETEETIVGASGHIMAVAYVGNPKR